MGLMIVMSNAPMVIDKIAEVMGITPPKVVYLTPNEAREAGLDVSSLPLAPDNEVSREEWCKANPKECRIQGEALLEKRNTMSRAMFGMEYDSLTTLQQDEVTAALDAGTPGTVQGTETMTQQGADNVPPIMVLPEDITEESDTRGAVIVRYTAYATDNSDIPVETVCEPKSGSIFELGNTMVKCTAIDASGNATMGEFMVTVTGEPGELSFIPDIPTP